MNVSDALQYGTQRVTGVLEQPALEVSVLLSHVLGCSRAQLYAREDHVLDDAQQKEWVSYLERRLNGEPLAYLLGFKEFWSLSFKVTPDTLIPRPETELLVQIAVERAPPNACLLDLGTGTGAIAIAIAHTRPDVRVDAVDVSPGALACAQHNVVAHGVGDRVCCVESHWCESLPSQRYDGVISNPPYLSEDDPHLSDLKYEPLGALVAGAQGTEAYRVLAEQIPRVLRPGGWCLFEHGHTQQDYLKDYFEKSGYQKVECFQDLAELPRALWMVCP